MRASVMVAGAGGAARAAIAAFFKAGFRKFLITNFDESEAAQMMDEVKRRFFSLDLQWVEMDKIVLLPGESAVLVNCTPVVEDNILLSELSYLNFLKRPGFLFDLAISEKESPLTHEAKDAGVQVINGLEMAAMTDVIWAGWAFQTKLDFATYFEKFKSSLR
jgi:shikimate 5-dehydrogenase